MSSTAAQADFWWKNAVVYCCDVETFYDSDGDGCGDIVGLVRKLDHLADLGVTCLWLMPFYPTADRDDGYDITDWYGVDDRLGSLGDVPPLVRMARERGMRVIVDLVVNHTSADHPWFRSALRGTDSPHRDYYVWRSDPPPDTSDEVVFPDQEDGIWTKDEASGEWYLHRFYRHQPDLNVGNEAVRDEITKVMGFWLELGVSGFRVDAVPFLVNPDTTDGHGHAPDPHDFLRYLREFLSRRHGGAIMLGEVNLPRDEQCHYFGGHDGDELDMQFDFVGMQHTYLALARHDARVLADSLRARPGIAARSQWATFLRNHDELTLDKLSDAERQEVFDAFGPEPEMQLYGRGLRRRLPPMLGEDPAGDQRRLRMAYSLLFSLPGTPVLFYGEEIGMGENLDVEGRQAVRTPMQWSSKVNGGFSRAEPDRLPNPVTTGAYGPEHVNVADQVDDPDSFLAFVSHLARRYRQSPELGWGDIEVLDTGHDHVLAHVMRWEEKVMLALHAFDDVPVTVEVSFADDEHDGYLTDLLDGSHVPIGDDGRVEVPLAGYGYRWLRLRTPADDRLA
ncbi:alpha-amylase family protein [Aquipuribacter nitratireducens]|uniref:Alpha-amylase n=1 Tax=Aquipuribacter nitratireducens TaxID=650104 RepID=A0ABW0GNG7_9MICO